jgi:hypothetical protein
MFSKHLRIMVKNGFNGTPGFDWEVQDSGHGDRIPCIAYGNEPTPLSAFQAGMRMVAELTPQCEAEINGEEIPPLSEWAQVRCNRQ